MDHRTRGQLQAERSAYWAYGSGSRSFPYFVTGWSCRCSLPRHERSLRLRSGRRSSHLARPGRLCKRARPKRRSGRAGLVADFSLRSVYRRPPAIAAMSSPFGVSPLSSQNMIFPADVLGLRVHDLRVVERPEGRSVEEPGGAGPGVFVPRKSLGEQLSPPCSPRPGLPRAGSRAARRLVEAVVGRRHARPAARVEKRAQDAPQTSGERRILFRARRSHAPISAVT